MVDDLFGGDFFYFVFGCGNLDYCVVGLIDGCLFGIGLVY